MTSRFAPSTTGEAHPGTLLSALLVWLDARARADRVILRLEDLDPERCKPEFSARMREDLAWLGLDWDEVHVQSQASAAHHAALDRLAAMGLLYPCSCSRSHIKRANLVALDGGYRYPNTCRGRALPASGWRAARESLRLRLPDAHVSLTDASGLDLSQDPARDMGDPVLVRRDGAIAYHLAVVVDDAQSGVDTIVRGRDIAPSTATHVVLQRLLGLTTPRYRHHFLLLEPRGQKKLAKFHGSVGARELAKTYTPAQLLGWLAWVAGLIDRPADVTPRALLPGFSWSRVSAHDRAIAWRDGALVLDQETSAP